MDILIGYILFFAYLLFNIRKQKSTKILSLPYWLVVAYSFLLFAHIISPFHYMNLFWPKILPYVFLSLFLLLVGYYSGLSKPVPRISNIGSVKVGKIFFISIIGGILLALDFVKNNTISLGMRVEEQTLSIVGVIGAALSYLSIIVWLYDVYQYERFSIKMKLRSIVSPLCFVVFTILSGGRQAILMLLLSTIIVVVYALKERREVTGTRPKNYVPAFVYVFIVLFIMYFGTVSSIRSQINNIDDKMDMFEGRITKLDPDFRDFIRDFPAGNFFVEFCYYYSHEFPRLYLIFKNYNYPPTLGFSQIGYVERRLQWLWGDWLEKSWNEQVNALEIKGQFPPNTWGTVITNNIVDFGRFGALFISFIIGYFVGTFTSRRKKSDMSYIIRQVWMCVGIIFSIQFSPFAELCWAFPLVFVSFFRVYE